MSPATQTRTPDGIIDGLLERQASVFDVIRSGTDRNHRFTRSIIEATRQGGRDWAEVSRRWITNPRDIAAVYEAASDAVADGQARSLALTREWIDDVVEAQRESRDLLRQSFGDLRDTVERAQTGAREIVERAGQNVPQFLRRENWTRRGNGADR